MASVKEGSSVKVVVSLVAAVIIAGGAFFLASGAAVASPNNAVANVISAIFSGKPTITISHASVSPSGTLVVDKEQTLAVFDVRANNVKWQATLNSLTMSVQLSGAQASYLGVNDYTLTYHYCTNAGTTYGYGYKGGSCGTMSGLKPSSMTRSGDTYTLVFQKEIPIYLAQSGGTLTLSAVPTYVRAGMKVVQVRAYITSGTGIGDQCKTIRYGFNNKYGYSKCGNQEAVVNVSGAKGGILTVMRPPGYGYPTKPVVVPPTPPVRASTTPWRVTP
ncbi:MAG: hypothetical protein V4437_00965 [Patescibacteria group bacterium]